MLLLSRADLAMVHACPEATMRLEQLLLIALESATSYEQDGDALAIVFGGGTLLFERGATTPSV
jgi:heat shock protein HslJ